jgi:hypothetical protein
MGIALQALQGLLPTGVSSLGERLALFGATLLIAAAGGMLFLAVFRLLGGLDARDRQQLANARLPFKRLVLRLL